MTVSLSLDGTWTLTFGPQGPVPNAEPPADFSTIPAQVPGNVEIDLARAGLLPDLRDGNEIYRALGLEGHEWWYAREFATPDLAAGERLELVFDGIDTVAEVRCNGQIVGRPSNMLIAHRFDVTEMVRAGAANQLSVHIASAVIEGRRRVPAPREFRVNGCYESNAVRKAAHMYGWDILPRLVSAGLWRGVRLEVVPATRWRSVTCATVEADATSRTAKLFVDWDFAAPEVSVVGWTMHAVVRRGARIVLEQDLVVNATHGASMFDLKDVDLWWPRGHGEPALHDLVLELRDGSGRARARFEQRIGLRTCRLDRSERTTADTPGQFQFVVNGEPVFVKGTNWVPLDGLHSRDREHLDKTFALVVDLNCNMVRCWGGGVYEEDRFFDLCDEHGVMVWQDFALACASYPDDDAFAAAMATEATAVVRRLRNHPSLVLWCGGNENDTALEWSPSHRHIDPNDDRVSREVLPRVVRREHPHGTYLAGSPFIGPELFRNGNRESERPEDHLWGPRDDFKGRYYAESNAHFVSEIGYHGCPSRRSLERWIGADAAWPWRQADGQVNDAWLTRAVRPTHAYTRYNKRIPLMVSQIEVLFGSAPDDFDAFVAASQISQAEALKFFIERFRIGKGRRTGILWWNLRDGWPVISDAIVDYDYDKKVAYEIVRRVQQDVCVMCDEATGRAYPVIAVNDTRSPVAGHATITRVDDGCVLLDTRFTIPANGKIEIGIVPASSVPSLYRIDWTVPGGSGVNHYAAGPRGLTVAEYARALCAVGITSSTLTAIAPQSLRLSSSPVATAPEKENPLAGIPASP